MHAMGSVTDASINDTLSGILYNCESGTLTNSEKPP